MFPCCWILPNNRTIWQELRLSHHQNDETTDYDYDYEGEYDDNNGDNNDRDVSMHSSGDDEMKILLICDRIEQQTPVL